MGRYIDGQDRMHGVLLSGRLGDRVDEDNPLRAVDVFVDAHAKPERSPLGHADDVRYAFNASVTMRAAPAVIAAAGTRPSIRMAQGAVHARGRICCNKVGTSSDTVG
jgi:hypothetical protein